MQQIRKELIQKLESADSLWIVSHDRPDGDAIGSSVALAHVLEGLGKKVVVFNSDEVPEVLRFLPEWERVVPPGAAPDASDRPDGLLVLDCSGRDRVSDRFWASVPSGLEVINIDHHVSNTRFGDWNLVDVDSPATGQLVYELVKEAGWPMDRAFAENIYAAISTDTGSFRFSSTTAATFRMAAGLVDLGVHVGEIGRLLYESYPMRRLELLRDLLPTLRLDFDGRCSSLTLTHAVNEAYHLKPGDTEGLIELIRSVEPVLVAVLFHEQADGSVRISSRSKDGSVSVGEICAHFGGGGHYSAAGARLDGPLEQAVESFIARVGEAVCP